MKKFILYDGRANYDEDKASVICCADDEKEALNDDKLMRDSYGDDLLWFEYDVGKGDELINGKARHDINVNKP